MDGESFVRKLKAESEQYLAKLDAEPLPDAHAGAAANVIGLLKLALKNEIEAVVIACEWVPTTPELEIALVLVRHAGDEARHFELLAERLRVLGADLSVFDPLTPPSPVLQYLRTLRTSAERIAAALVAREAMGGRRNAQFLKFLEAVGQSELAALYRDVINADEERHHAAGCAVLARLATTPEAQEAARRAALRLLEIGDQVRSSLLEKTGAPVVPGC